MRKFRHVVVGMLVAGSATADPVAAQSDILLRLRSGSPAGDRMRVDSAGGLVALGELGYGIIPASGAQGGGAVRMMWYPYKGSFRAGGPGASGSTAWDDANQGFYSWAGGLGSIASQYTTFAFGDGAQATASYSIAIGFRANAADQGSVALGYRTTATGNYSMALGHRASTNDFTGAFVWSDASSTDSVLASANNQFSARAAGGYRLFTNATKTTGMQMAAGGSSWTVISDRNRKSDFTLFGGEALLETLRRVPVTKWRYIDEEDRSTWHVGPMAQDWHAAFGLTTDDKVINTSDMDGVNLAAIQALETRTTQLREENHALRNDVGTLRAENAELRQRLERIEALLKPRVPQSR